MHFLFVGNPKVESNYLAEGTEEEMHRLRRNLIALLAGYLPADPDRQPSFGIEEGT